MNLRELIILWLAGLGIPSTILEDETVKREMAHEPIDGLGILEALRMAAYSLPDNIRHEACDNLHKPQYQLELITLVNSGGNEMVTFGT